MDVVHEQRSVQVGGPLDRRFLEITLSMLALVTIVAFEAMAVSTAMPTVAAELDAVRSYGLAFSVMLTGQLLGIVLAGVWSDRSGPLVGTFVGQGLLAVGAAICGFATSFEMLLLGRALTGLGGGLLVVMLYVIAGRAYPEELRPRLFTYVSAAWILPSLLGPPLSAWLTETFSWRWVFWGVVLPVAVTMLVLLHAARRIDSSALTASVSTRDHAAHVRAAWAGLGIAVAAGAVQYGTHELELSWSPKTAVGAAGLVGVVLVAPVLVPRGTWLMARGVPSVMLSRAMMSAAFGAAVTYVPLYLVDQRGSSLQTAGIAIATGSIGWAAGAWYQGHAKLPVPRHRLVEFGGAILAAGLVLLAASALWTLSLVVVVLAMVLLGLAMGLGVTTTTVLALELSPVAEHGETSSALQLSDVLGGVLGVAAATALFAALHVPGDDAGLFGMIFFGLAVVGLVAVPAGQRIST